jgi:hypothetical protein
MNATRRTIVAALAAGTLPVVAVPDGIAAAAPDPALDLVNRCRAADDEYDRRSKGAPLGFDDETLIDETWGPVFPLLHEAPDATTLNGAIAMLEHFLHASLTMEPGDVMIESALAYLRTLPRRAAA